MAYGMRIWDSLGRVQIDTTTRLSRVLGTVVTPASSGSVTNADFSTGTMWFIFKYDCKNFNYNEAILINVVVIGNTLSWTYSMTTGRAVPADPTMRLIYGVY